VRARTCACAVLIKANELAGTKLYYITRENLISVAARARAYVCFQLSGDESRRLCAGGAKAPEKGDAEAVNLGVATYGSVVFQLKDAHLEANGICDFVFRALTVIGKTMTFTVCLTCLSTVPILMFIFGE